jgi:hypothetical protein
MGPPQERGWSRLLLSEVACLPREFTIVVEEENPAAARNDRHELRMTFDVSPYPALEAYNEQGRSGLRGESTIPWLNEPRSFCAGQLPVSSREPELLWVITRLIVCVVADEVMGVDTCTYGRPVVSR